jgi:hypothetical protein
MKHTYSKQAHTFTEDGKTINAIVYGGLSHPNDIYGNIHIEDLGEGKFKGGRYMLTIGNDGWMSNDLAELEAILFPWMEYEGYEYDA